MALIHMLTTRISATGADARAKIRVDPPEEEGPDDQQRWNAKDGHYYHNQPRRLVCKRERFIALELR